MKKSYVIIFVLIGIVCLLAIGFAAFSTNLKINGTASIDTSWDVEIINIESKNKIGDASDTNPPVYTKTSATFKTTLVSPGDSMTYDVTVKNSGTVDAKVDKITLTDSNNPAIIFQTSGIAEGDVLTAGSSDVFTVIVSYNNAVTMQPSVLNASLTVKLDYVQNS
ncbi:MAG: hypothetical protein IKG27_04075 [Bacilli bacterium]|nr:hypothetical protein [Bacilli bacterium]